MSRVASSDVARKFTEHIAGEAAVPIVFASASGSRITDIEGQSYLDFITGYGVVSTGHSRPEIIDAMTKQAHLGCFAQPWLPTKQALSLAEELLTLGPPHLVACARATSGAEANEAALRAHHAVRGGKVLVVGRAYHGGTATTLATSDAEAFHLPRGQDRDSPRVPPAHCFRCAYGKSHPGCAFECVQAIDSALQRDPTITAIMLEPILGSGGVIVPPRDYFVELQTLCHRRKVMLIVDEVMTGCGRTGTWTASQAFDLTPDALTLAKGLSGGYIPIGTALVTRELSQGLKQYEDVSPTMAWTPLACAATLANVRLLQTEKLTENAATLGPVLQSLVRELFAKHLPVQTGEVRGRGLMIGIEMVKDQRTREPNPSLVKRLILLCLRRGLMLGTSWDWHTVIMMPPLSVTRAECDEALVILGEVLQRLAQREGAKS